METFEFTRLRMKSNRRQLALRIAIVAFSTACSAAVGFAWSHDGTFSEVLSTFLFAFAGQWVSTTLTEQEK